ncbi:hypothetical protein HYH03_010068 [Edaphochlamys debaryana]|uniref:VTC domain-containing protein n=1 Tax=Edaphochlamys debaryana TaxID=47281 RepID=A0A835XWX4_9CHLO|nr:hypothetical protein HYH03_010068 [Edaphochlamys debaryana]|eukprot:KAG2491701.1 hypothetical protein HYH03_010068 [Edaphochlamys debaryana]
MAPRGSHGRSPSAQHGLAPGGRLPIPHSLSAAEAAANAPASAFASSPAASLASTGAMSTSVWAAKGQSSVSGGASGGCQTSAGPLVPSPSAAEIHRAGSVDMAASSQRPPASLERYAVRTGALRSLLPAAADPRASAAASAAGGGGCNGYANGYGVVIPGPGSSPISSSGGGSGGGGSSGSGSPFSATPASVVGDPADSPFGSDTGGPEGHGGVALTLLRSQAEGRAGCGSPDGEDSGAAANPPVATGSPFLRAYAAELSRVRGFTQSSLDELRRRAGSAAEHLTNHLNQHVNDLNHQPLPKLSAGAGGGAGGGGAPAAGLVAAAALRALCGRLRAECDEIGHQLADLDAFERINAARFAELGLLYDRSAAAASAGGSGRTGGAPPTALAQLELLREYQRVARACLGGAPAYDGLLVILSDLYEAISTAHTQAGEAEEAEPWVPPDQFKRSTTKFWVAPRDVLRVKLTIVRHLPLLIFGRSANPLLVRAASVQQPPPSKSTSASTPASAGLSSSLPAVLPSAVFSPLTQGTTSPASSLAPSLAPSMVPSLSLSAPAAPTAPGTPAPPPPPSPRPPASTSRITSVYFDNAALDTYHERLVRGDGASLVRIRWYGEDLPRPHSPVFVERKRHRDAWTGEWSLKERAPLPCGRVVPLLSGAHLPELQPPAPGPLPTGPLPTGPGGSGRPPTSSLTSAGSISISGSGAGAGLGPEGGRGGGGAKAAAAAQLLREVQGSLLARQEEPYLRTAYRRSAFQLASTNAVRISIDTQLAMSREAGAPRAPGGWCRDDAAPLAPGDVVHFPYAVLEIKLADEDSVPAWVLELRESGLLVEAPKFSKFLHGMALLYPDRIRNTPHWFLPEPELDPKQIPDLDLERQREGKGGGGRKEGGASGWLRPGAWLRGRGAERGGGGGVGGGGAGGWVAGLLGAAGQRRQPRMSPATLEELADPADKYEQEAHAWLFPRPIRPDEALDIVPDPDDAYDIRKPPPPPLTATAANGHHYQPPTVNDPHNHNRNHPHPHLDGLGPRSPSVTRYGPGPGPGPGGPGRAHFSAGGAGSLVGGSPSRRPQPPQRCLSVGGLERVRSGDDPGEGEGEGEADVFGVERDHDRDRSRNCRQSGELSTDCSRPSSVRSSLLPTVEATSLAPLSPTASLPASASAIAGRRHGAAALASFTADAAAAAATAPAAAATVTATAFTAPYAAAAADGYDLPPPPPQPSPSVSGGSPPPSYPHSHRGSIASASASSYPGSITLRPSNSYATFGAQHTGASGAGLGGAASGGLTNFGSIGSGGGYAAAANGFAFGSGTGPAGAGGLGMMSGGGSGGGSRGSPDSGKRGVGGGGNGLRGGGGSFKATLAGGAAAARAKVAGLAAAVRRSSGSGGSGGALRRNGSVSSGPSHPAPPRLSAAAAAWIGTKWRAARRKGGAANGGGGGGGGGGGPDLEAGAAAAAGSGVPLPRAAAMVRTRVEPKTFFAAERTFLSWLNIAVLVMFTSLSLMSDRIAMFGGHQSIATPPLPNASTPPPPPGGANGALLDTAAPSAAAAAGGAASRAAALCSGGICRSSQIAGMAMAPVALAFMLYALYMYKSRSAQILRREAVRYDDQRGPVVLTAMLMIVLVIAYVLTIRAATAAGL